MWIRAGGGSGEMFINKMWIKHMFFFKPPFRSYKNTFFFDFLFVKTAHGGLKSKLLKKKNQNHT